jgi:probable phosphoglycerate mutase
MNLPLPEVFIVRHGETEWTITGQMTGRIDLPLTPRGEDEARQVPEELRGLEFSEVLTSPWARARRTCELAGFGDRARSDPDLAEWDYGEYQGRRTEDVVKERPGWSLFRDGCPGGESPADVEARADRVVRHLREAGGRALLFGHGHFSRVLAVRWLGFAVVEARHLYLSPAAVSILGYEHSIDTPVLRAWNREAH